MSGFRVEVEGEAKAGQRVCARIRSQHSEGRVGGGGDVLVAESRIMNASFLTSCK
jgi:hypothetical protein